MNGIRSGLPCPPKTFVAARGFLIHVHPVGRGGVTSVVCIVYGRRRQDEKLRSLNSSIALSRPNAGSFKVPGTTNDSISRICRTWDGMRLIGSNQVDRHRWVHARVSDLGLSMQRSRRLEDWRRRLGDMSGLS